MKKLNKTTKKAHGFIWNYTHSEFCTIYSAYARPSLAKIRAYEAIDLERADRCGYGTRITSKSCNFFTMAYRYIDQDTGHEILVYHTPTECYLVDLND